MIATEWAADGMQIVRGLRCEDAAALGLGEERDGLRLRLDHRRQQAWYGVDPEGAWQETGYDRVTAWAWERGLLLGPPQMAEWARLDPRMQLFVGKSGLYAVRDGFVVDTELRRGVTEAELRVEMALAGGAEFCGPGD